MAAVVSLVHYAAYDCIDFGMGHSAHDSGVGHTTFARDGWMSLLKLDDSE
jgi:hypothetical protein